MQKITDILLRTTFMITIYKPQVNQSKDSFNQFHSFHVFREGCPSTMVDFQGASSERYFNYNIQQIKHTFDKDKNLFTMIVQYYNKKKVQKKNRIASI